MRVNAADYGVPQVRNRVILVAFRADLGVDMAAFENSVEPTHSRDLLIKALRDESYWDDRQGRREACTRSR